MTECLRPLLTSMRLCGLYFSRRREVTTGDEPDNKSCKWNPWMIHAVFVIALLWLNVVRMFSAFTSEDEFGLILLSKIITVVWMTQCAVSQTAFYATSHLGTLQDVFLKMTLSDKCATYLRKMALVCTAVAWSVIVVGSAFFVYIFFFSDEFMDIVIAPLQSYVTISNTLIPRIVVYFFTFYLQSAYVFPQVVTFLLAVLLRFQFKRVNEALERYLDCQDGRMGDCEIEAIRQQHQEIAMSVSRIDDCLMFSNASAFCCQLFCFIIVLYMLVFYHSFINDPFVMTGYVVWVILMSAGLAFTAAGGIIINHYVSKSNASK